ncbi:DUF1254 domain-containing protein [Mycolicibacterium peregrinum]|uniref:DUF1254 domain-containing protein n=1 Tax=Mycolicibacterium peregrinum TaxID=43304 RepID=UPI003AAFE707
MKYLSFGLTALLLAAVVSCGGSKESTGAAPTPETVRQIVKEAYIYGFPMVDSYRIQHAYFVDKANPQYKGDWNQTHSIARVFTPEDTTIQTPNSDTPYTMLGADLRAEPLVLTVPPIEAGRYYSLQFIDSYTYNFAYVGSRATGNGGGKYLLAGPSWKGDKPAGIAEVIRSDTDFALVIYRTQLFDPKDIDNVKKIQAGYTVEPLSAFVKQPAPTAPAVDFIAPLTPDEQKTSPKFFQILNFLLKYAPEVPSEKELRARFATIGIGPDGDFNPDTMSKETLQAVQDGMADAWAEVNTFKKDKLDSGQVTSADLFGTREALKDNYLYRMAAAVLGIYGNTAQEAIYPVLAVDSTGAPLTGNNNYTVRFAPGQLPPVNSFWSTTMYKMPQSLLVANPINRYLINSPMLPSLVKDPDGGVTIYVQNQSPGAEKEANWLPAPDGPFQMILRLYWPKEAALNGTWQPPKVTKH